MHQRHFFTPAKLTNPLATGSLEPMSESSIASLAEGKLYALQNAYELDGRVSSYPASARGFTAANCYLLKQDDGALLLDTGYAAHEAAILEQLGVLLDAELPLHLFPLRINEFMSVCNAMPIAERFNVVACYAPFPDVECWLDFNWDGRDGDRAAPLSVATALLGSEQQLQVGSAGARPIEAFSAPIRLINTSWIYDGTTRTLFTSDMFTHNWRDNPDGPWIIAGNDDAATVDFVRSFLLNTRYWWLEGAAIDTLRRKVSDVFERYDIETIAPGYGCIVQGRDLVAREFSVLDEVLRSLDKAVAAPQYVFRGMER
ncbi:MAG: hypothetical protein V3R26_07470 [Hyphomicrobium sp.]